MSPKSGRGSQNSVKGRTYLDRLYGFISRHVHKLTNTKKKTSSNNPYLDPSTQKFIKIMEILNAFALGQDHICINDLN